MTINVYLLIPEGLTFDQLTEEQQTAIHNVFGQYVMPMPATHAVDGTVICDALCDDSFNPNVMQDFGLDWEIIYMRSQEGTQYVPLDEEKFLERLNPKYTYDEEGNITDTQPATLHQPHVWSGWSKWDEQT